MEYTEAETGDPPHPPPRYSSCMCGEGRGFRLSKSQARLRNWIPTSPDCFHPLRKTALEWHLGRKFVLLWMEHWKDGFGRSSLAVHGRKSSFCLGSHDSERSQTEREGSSAIREHGRRRVSRRIPSLVSSDRLGNRPGSQMLRVPEAF